MSSSSLVVRPAGNSSADQDNQLAVRTQHESAVKISGNEKYKKVARKVGYVVGTAGCVGGTVITIVPFPGSSIVGLLIAAGGASLLTATGCDSRRAVENRKYKKLNEVHETEVRRLARQIAALQQENNQYRELNRENQLEIITLRQEIDRFAQERTRSSEDVARLDQIAGLLNGGLAEFLENVQRNTQIESSALSAFKTKIGQCTDLINRFEEGSASSIATILNVLERFISSLLSTQEKLENTKRELSSTLGKLQLLEREFEQTTHRSGQKLREFETESTKAQELIDKKDKYEQYLNGQNRMIKELSKSADVLESLK